MAGLVNGDITESFFHLSLDHSEHLSSGDEVSVHTTDDFLNYLRLARAHDANTKRHNHQNNFSADFPGDITGLSRDSVRKNTGHAKGAAKIRENAFKRHFSDSVLLLESSHVTPVAHGRDFRGKNGQTLRPRDHFMEHTSRDSILDYTTASFNGDPTILRDELTGIRGIDVESLFKAFQPLLDDYLSKKNPIQDPQNVPESDPDSAFDDTFDRPKRSTTARLARPELSSPVTSPPQSSGGSQFCFDKSTEVDDDDICQPIETQIHKPREQRKLILQAPQLDLGDLTADEIELDYFGSQISTEKETENRAAEAKKDALEEMQLKLDQYKKDNEGMQNEIKFLKCKIDAISANTQKPAQEQHTCRLNGSEDSCVNTNNGDYVDSYKKNLPEQFVPYYDRLQLSKVDELSNAEKSYMIKNVLLLLLLSNFDNLSKTIPKVGKYVLKTTAFLDDTHEILYPDQKLKPLDYLRNYNLEIDGEFTKCLEQMLRRIKEALSQ